MHAFATVPLACVLLHYYVQAISYQPTSIKILVYYILYTTIDHEYNPDSHLTMKALVTLEWGMNVPVLTKLQSNLGNLIKLTGVQVKQLRRQTEWLVWASYVGHSL